MLISIVGGWRVARYFPVIRLRETLSMGGRLRQPVGSGELTTSPQKYTKETLCSDVFNMWAGRVFGALQWLLHMPSIEMETSLPDEKVACSSNTQ